MSDNQSKVTPAMVMVNDALNDRLKEFETMQTNGEPLSEEESRSLKALKSLRKRFDQTLEDKATRH